jgi:hypothetical protein
MGLLPASEAVAEVDLRPSHNDNSIKRALYLATLKMFSGLYDFDRTRQNRLSMASQSTLTLFAVHKMQLTQRTVPRMYSDKETVKWKFKNLGDCKKNILKTMQVNCLQR